MRRAILLLPLLLLGCDTGSPAPAAPPVVIVVTATPPVPAVPLTITGTGSQNSAPFRLAGGRYLVTWQADHASGSGVFGGRLMRPDGGPGPGGMLANTVLDGPLTGTTMLYNVPSAEYYIEQNGANTTWSVTFTQPPAP